MRLSIKGFHPQDPPLLPPVSPVFPYRSLLWIGPGEACIRSTHDRPNWWFRLWQRAFFGFIWEDISEQNTTRQ